MKYSDYIVYVDESGDHGLRNIDPQHPVFVLAFCIFEKPKYIEDVISSVQRLKFHFWGHDGVILHSHEIRKAKGDFNILLNPNVRAEFLPAINNLMEEAEFTLIAAVIDKTKLVNKYVHPVDPYEIALAFCMERLQRFLMDNGQTNEKTHVMVECRGKPEDNALELEFRRICDGRNHVGKMPNLNIIFMDKKHNSAGLQFADLVAHPIGRHHIRPNQPNQAFDIVETKFRRSPNGKIPGFGLKTFP